MLQQGGTFKDQALLRYPAQAGRPAAGKDQGVEVERVLLHSPSLTGSRLKPPTPRDGSQAARSGSRNGSQAGVGFSSSLICQMVPCGGSGTNRSFQPISAGV
jgi:hypothetical protein